METKHCSPSREELVLSCYTDNELASLLGRYESREVMVSSLTDRLGPDQTEWSSTTTSIFRPIQDWKSNGWLSNFNIDDCLSQYEEVYPNYRHLGTEAVDFWYYNSNDLRYPKLGPLIDSGVKQMSLVIILQGHSKATHYESHWVLVFIDLDSYTIDYFDSADFPLYPVMQFLLYELQLFISLYNNKKILLKRSHGEIQKYDGDCGVFVIDFAVRRLEGITYEGYVEFMRTLEGGQKKYIKKMRNYYFRL